MFSPFFRTRVPGTLAVTLAAVLALVAVPRAQAVVQTFAQFTSHNVDNPAAAPLTQDADPGSNARVSDDAKGFSFLSATLSLDDVKDFFQSLTNTGTGNFSSGPASKADARPALGALVVMVGLLELFRRFRRGLTAISR